jgi:hypothetical protein
MYGTMHPIHDCQPSHLDLATVVVSNLLPLFVLPRNMNLHLVPTFALQLWGQLHASSESGKMLALAEVGRERESERRGGRTYACCRRSAS